MNTIHAISFELKTRVMQHIVIMDSAYTPERIMNELATGALYTSVDYDLNGSPQAIVRASADAQEAVDAEFSPVAIIVSQEETDTVYELTNVAYEEILESDEYDDIINPPVLKE